MSHVIVCIFLQIPKVCWFESILVQFFKSRVKGVSLLLSEPLNRSHVLVIGFLYNCQPCTLNRVENKFLSWTDRYHVQNKRIDPIMLQN